MLGCALFRSVLGMGLGACSFALLCGHVELELNFTAMRALTLFYWLCSNSLQTQRHTPHLVHEARQLNLLLFMLLPPQIAASGKCSSSSAAWLPHRSTV